MLFVADMYTFHTIHFRFMTAWANTEIYIKDDCYHLIKLPLLLVTQEWKMNVFMWLREAQNKKSEEKRDTCVCVRAKLDTLWIPASENSENKNERKINCIGTALWILVPLYLVVLLPSIPLADPTHHNSCSPFPFLFFLYVIFSAYFSRTIYSFDSFCLDFDAA